MHMPLHVHATCVSSDGAAVVILGESGSGKSDLALRLIDRGFELVADDRVEIEDGWARAPAGLAGLLEVRGLGIMRMPYRARARVALAIEIDQTPERLPLPSRHDALGVALVRIDPAARSAALRVELALDCLRGRVAQVVGALA